jgi:hypothetical protein
MSDATTPGRNRGGAGRPVADAPRQVPRSRLPLPPVPAAAAPRASGTPFRAVPSPELPGGRPGNASVVLPRPARTWDDEPALVSTGPGLLAEGHRAGGPAPRLPRPTTPSGQPSPAYGDWTKPSHPSEPIDLPFDPGFAADDSGQFRLQVPLAPATTAIPERPVNRRGRRATEAPEFDSAQFDSAALDSTEFDSAALDSTEFDRSRLDSAEFDRSRLDSAEFDGPALAPASDEFAARGLSTGTGRVGGRAAVRAELRAMDEKRRKAAKRNGEAVGIPDDEDTPRRSRRVLMGLVAMTVVALGVLGVYSVVSPETQEASSGSTATQSSAPAPADVSAVLPPLETPELDVETAPPAAPVKAPVTVLNATEINGLAADVAAVLAAGGWETPGVGTYLADDIATSTVFYTEGDENQRQAAESLKAQFPQLQTAAERFFEVPEGVAAPGLVVVLTAEWQP